MRSMFLLMFVFFSCVFAAGPQGCCYHKVLSGLAQQVPKAIPNFLASHPLSVFPSPPAFRSVTTDTVLAASGSVQSYYVHSTADTEDGFFRGSSTTPLPQRWQLLRNGASSAPSDNVVDAYLPTAVRRGIIPSEFNDEDLDRAGSIVCSPQGAYTHLHFDGHELPGRTYQAAWMYLVEGQKKWLFADGEEIKKRMLTDMAPVELVKRMSGFSYEHARSILHTNKIPTYETKIGPNDLLYFHGEHWWHAVETTTPSLGIGGELFPKV